MAAESAFESKNLIRRLLGSGDPQFLARKSQERLTGTHDLAIERGKWVGFAKQWQLSKMCHDDVTLSMFSLCANHDAAVQPGQSIMNRAVSIPPTLAGLNSPKRVDKGDSMSRNAYIQVRRNMVEEA